MRIVRKKDLANLVKQEVKQHPPKKQLPPARMSVEHMNKVINDQVKGKMQKMIDAGFNHRYTMSSGPAVMAYLNPGHQTNWRDATPLPDGSQGAVYLVKDCWTYNITAIGDTLVFYNLPFLECPFAYWDGVNFHGVYAPSMLNANGVPFDYCQNNHVYAHRCIGKSSTIVPTTAALQVAGSVNLGRKPADVDCDTVSYVQGAATDVTNQKCLQRLPTNAAAVSALANGETWFTKEGAYLISHHSGHGWQVRSDFAHKVYPHAAATNNANCRLLATTAAGTALTVWDSAGTTNSAHVSNVDEMDIPIACFSGLQNGHTFVVKCAMVYELQLKASSPLIKYQVPRPIFDPSLMDALYAYESLLDRSGLYPADYNFWDKVWSGFKKFWNGGGGNAVKLIGNAIEPGVGTALSSVGGAATSLF